MAEAAARRLLPLAAALLLAAPAWAHKSSDAYLALTVQGETTALRWDIALRDLDAALPTLDADGNRALTWGEIRAAWPQIDALALSSLAIDGCRFAVTGHALERRSDGAYAVLLMAAPCRVEAATPLRYGLFRDIDATHRGLLRLAVDGGAPSVRMLLPQAMAASVAATAAVQSPPLPETAPSRASAAPAEPAPAESAPPAADAHAPTSFIREGVHHILTGYDHLLFLLCLLLPAVMTRRNGRWEAVSGWRQALWPVAKTVTLFTLAHSLTLALAALGWVRLSPSLIEPAIAVTIMLAAFDNLRPLLLRWRGAITFAFGLIHGFGFAGVLAEMQLPTTVFGWALLQFNLGIELGQLALVLGVVPLLYLLRRNRGYVRGVLGAGSTLALLTAGVWLIERTTDLRLLAL